MKDKIKRSTLLIFLLNTLLALVLATPSPTPKPTPSRTLSTRRIILRSRSPANLHLQSLRSSRQTPAIPALYSAPPKNEKQQQELSAVYGPPEVESDMATTETVTEESLLEGVSTPSAEEGQDDMMMDNEVTERYLPPPPTKAKDQQMIETSPFPHQIQIHVVPPHLSQDDGSQDLRSSYGVPESRAEMSQFGRNGGQYLPPQGRVQSEEDSLGGGSSQDGGYSPQNEQTSYQSNNRNQQRAETTDHELPSQEVETPRTENAPEDKQRNEIYHVPTTFSYSHSQAFEPQQEQQSSPQQYGAQQNFAARGNAQQYQSPFDNQGYTQRQQYQPTSTQTQEQGNFPQQRQSYQEPRQEMYQPQQNTGYQISRNQAQSYTNDEQYSQGYAQPPKSAGNNLQNGQGQAPFQQGYPSIQQQQQQPQQQSYQASQQQQPQQEGYQISGQQQQEGYRGGQQAQQEQQGYHNFQNQPQHTNQITEDNDAVVVQAQGQDFPQMQNIFKPQQNYQSQGYIQSRPQTPFQGYFSPSQQPQTQNFPQHQTDQKSSTSTRDQQQQGYSSRNSSPDFSRTQNGQKHSSQGYPQQEPQQRSQFPQEVFQSPQSEYGAPAPQTSQPLSQAQYFQGNFQPQPQFRSNSLETGQEEELEGLNGRIVDAALLERVQRIIEEHEREQKALFEANFNSNSLSPKTDSASSGYSSPQSQIPDFQQQSFNNPGASQRQSSSQLPSQGYDGGDANIVETSNNGNHQYQKTSLSNQFENTEQFKPLRSQKPQAIQSQQYLPVKDAQKQGSTGLRLIAAPQLGKQSQQLQHEQEIETPKPVYGIPLAPVIGLDSNENFKVIEDPSFNNENQQTTPLNNNYLSPQPSPFYGRNRRRVAKVMRVSPVRTKFYF